MWLAMGCGRSQAGRRQEQQDALLESTADASLPAKILDLAPAQLLEHVLELFSQHKVTLAGRFLQVLEEKGILPPTNATIAGKLEALRTVYRRVVQLRTSLANTKGWEVQRDSGGIRCLFQGHSSGFVRILLEAEVEAPVFDLIALLREVELWQRWVPSFAGLGLTASRQLGHTSPLNMCFHTVIHLPWPFSDRSCTFAVDGIDCMDTADAPQQVVVLLDSSLAQRNCLQPIKKSKSTAVELLDSGVVITPGEVAGTKHTFVQVIVTVDPKMSVPRWLVNVAVRNMCFLLMVQLRHAVSVTRGEDYLAKTTDPDNEFYAFIRKRMAESLPKELSLAPSVGQQAARISRSLPSPRSPLDIANSELFCCGFRKSGEMEVEPMTAVECNAGSTSPKGPLDTEGCATSSPKQIKPDGAGTAQLLLHCAWKVPLLLLLLGAHYLTFMQVSK